ncbi:MAG TPA: hypothetical protein VLB29_10855 [Nocardioidaceae bacterium]|nr:hypothetical protein [Nocardioidaceae bacterium]
MLVLGIIAVLLAAAIVLVALVGGAGQPAGLDLGAVEIETNTFSVFLTGAITVVVLVAGVALIQSGVRRARRRRQEKKELNRLQKREAQETLPSATETKADEPTGAEDATRSTETRTDTTLTDQDRSQQ